MANSADLHRALDINPRLAWQVFRVAHAENPVTEAVEVPKPAAMNRFLEAARKRHVAADAIDRVSETFEEFEQLVREHAGDRRSFDSMVSALSGPASQPLSVQQRRAAYIANSDIFGVQARTRLACYIFGPGPVPNRADVVTMRGFIDLRWLRRERAPFVVSRFRMYDNDGVARQGEPVRQPLDHPDPNEDETHGLALLRQFCSDPMPRIRATPTPDGFMKTEIISEDVGNASARTVLIGETLRGTESLHRDEHNPYLQISTMMRTPCEALVQDVLVYDGMFGKVQPETLTFSDTQRMDGQTWNREADLLPQHATVKYLGRGPEVMHCRDVPRYPEMVRYAMERKGWDANKLDVYRCRIEYPVLPSTTMLQFEKPPPEKPE